MSNLMGRDIPLSPSPSPPPPDTGALAPSEVVPSTPPTNEAQAPPDPDEVVRAQLETNVRTVLDKLFDIASYVADVPQGGENGVQTRVQDTVRSLGDLMNMAPRVNHQIPEDVVELIDTGRNPDQHTRQNLTRLANDNQQMLGQNLALGEYREQLQAALGQSFPEIDAFLEPSSDALTSAPDRLDSAAQPSIPETNSTVP